MRRALLVDPNHYDKLIDKINKAKDFNSAFEVIPLRKEEMEIATRTFDF